jgi:NAD(P)-dependent dehydrogenase (short-subunit alcohol dehydrogenase family)
MMDKAIVIGVGPQDGLGGQLCARFAQRGMHVFIGGRTPETLEARVGAYGGFLFGREAARRMRDKGGTLLFTGASASLRGRANFGAFNASKSALRTLAQAMAKEFNADGIHVGHIVIDGPIGGEKIKKGLPDYAEKLGNRGFRASSTRTSTCTTNQATHGCSKWT